MSEMWSTFEDSILSLFSAPNTIILQISCILCLLNWKRLSIPFNILGGFLWFNLAIEWGAFVIAVIFRNNMPLLHLYTLGEFLLWSWFYRSIMGKDNWFVRHFWRFVGGVMGLILVNSLFIQPIWTFNTYTKTLVQLIVIGYAFAYAFRLPEETAEKDTKQKALSWVNAAVLIYYCGSLFIFMSGFFIQNTQVSDMLVLANKTLNTIFQLLILFALWKVIYNPIKSSSSSASPS